MSRKGVRLTRDDWIRASFVMLAELGVEKLAVEPLARRLRTTKGSFYWHFEDRADLLRAVLAAWQERATDTVIADVDHVAPGRRVEALLSGVVGDTYFPDGVEWAILSAAGRPEIRTVVEQVHRTRLDYLNRLFAEAGLHEARARARARICYATYLGNLQLTRLPEYSTPETDDAERSYTAELIRLVSPT